MYFTNNTFIKSYSPLLKLYSVNFGACPLLSLIYICYPLTTKLYKPAFKFEVPYVQIQLVNLIQNLNAFFNTELPVFSSSHYFSFLPCAVGDLRFGFA